MCVTLSNMKLPCSSCLGIALFVYLNSSCRGLCPSACWVCHAACVDRWGAAIAPVMTSGNGNTNSSQHNGESKPAQALVKSHILTHLIEGFVIQEGAEPFPVSTGALPAFVCKVTQTQIMIIIWPGCRRKLVSQLHITQGNPQTALANSSSWSALQIQNY